MDVTAASRERTRDSLRARPIDRGGARQPERFDPARAHLLGGTERERWLPYARIREMLNVPAGGTVVDFGAGTGAIALPLAADFPGTTIVALDEQPAMLERLVAAAGSSPPSNLVTTTGAATTAETAPGAADRVLAVNVLHEVGDEELSRMRDLLAPDGYALVIDWRSDVERSVGPPAKHAYTEEEAVARLEAAGFEVTPQPDTGFPYHFALVARAGGADSAAAARRREELLARIRARGGLRLTIETTHGTFAGHIDAADLSASPVVVLVRESPGSDAATALVIDLASIVEIREA